MENLFEKIGIGLIGACITWIIAKFYNRSRLYCSLSRLYEYSTLANGGSTVQLVIANRGRKVEESVEVQFSTDYEYHLVAATQNGITIPADKTIRLPALLPKSEVSLVMLAEGRPQFSKANIRSIRSKTANGLIGDSLADAEASSSSILPALLTLALTIAVMGYFIGKTFGEEAWRWGSAKILVRQVQPFKEGCITYLSNGTKQPKPNELNEAQLKTLALSTVNIDRVSTRGDELFANLTIKNPIAAPIEYSVKLLSQAADSSTDWRIKGNTFIFDIVLAEEGETRSYELSSYFPEERIPQRFWLETRFEVGNYWVTVKRAIFFGKSAPLKCSQADDISLK